MNRNPLKMAQFSKNAKDKYQRKIISPSKKIFKKYIKKTPEITQEFRWK